jgi:hypothetical protein
LLGRLCLLLIRNEECGATDAHQSKDTCSTHF